MPTLRLLGGVLALLAVTALVSPMVADGLAAVGWEVTFSRVYNRVFEVLLVGLLVVRRRHLDLGSADAIGWRAPERWPALRRGLLVGFVGLSTALAFCYLAGGLVPEVRYPDTTKMVRKGVQGLAAGAVVGAFEEVVFRGILLRRLSLDLGGRAGMLATTTLYAALHLLHPRGAAEHDALAGVRRTLEILAPLADPTNLPTFVGLFAFGALLAWARLRTGTLWTSIGIHAAWVAIFRVFRLFVRVRVRPVWLVGVGWPPLIGSATGAVALLVTALLLARTLRGTRASSVPISLGNRAAL